MLNHLSVTYHQHREEWLFDGLGHSSEQAKKLPGSPAFLHSMGAQVTSQPGLSQWGHQHRDSLPSGKNIASASSSTKPQIMQGRPSPGTNAAWPMRSGVCSPPAVLKKHF